MAKRNSQLPPHLQSALDSMKYEIAEEFGIQLGPDTIARENGTVGGEITRRLVQYAENLIQQKPH